MKRIALILLCLCAAVGYAPVLRGQTLVPIDPNPCLQQRALVLGRRGAADWRQDGYWPYRSDGNWPSRQAGKVRDGFFRVEKIRKERIANTRMHEVVIKDKKPAGHYTLYVSKPTCKYYSPPGRYIVYVSDASGKYYKIYSEEDASSVYGKKLEKGKVYRMRLVEYRELPGTFMGSLVVFMEHRQRELVRRDDLRRDIYWYRQRCENLNGLYIDERALLLGRL